MRSAICLLTAMTVMGACGGEMPTEQPEPMTEIKVFKLKPRMIDGTMRNVADLSSMVIHKMTRAQALDFRQNAIHDGTTYVGSCTGGTPADKMAYGNEYVFFDRPDENTAECFYAGGGASVTWFFSMDDAYANYSPSGRQLFHTTTRYRYKANDNATKTRVALHKNNVFGGGTICDVGGLGTWLNQGQSRDCLDTGYQGGSVLMCATPACNP